MKRLISTALITLTALNLSITPTATAQTAEPPPLGVHNVRIAAMCEEMNTWLSDPISVTGVGTYSGTLHFGDNAPATLVNLAITSDLVWICPSFAIKPFDENNFTWAREDFHDGVIDTNPQVPEALRNFAVAIRSITANESVALTSDFRGYFARRDFGSDIADFVFLDLWNGWWEPNQTISPAREVPLETWGATAFGLEGGAAFESIEITFTLRCHSNLGILVGRESATVHDAIAILRFAVDLPSILDTCPDAFAAALIVSEDEPGARDAIEILRSLVGLPSALDSPDST
jgi:hypothetical protein